MLRLGQHPSAGDLRSFAAIYSVAAATNVDSAGQPLTDPSLVAEANFGVKPLSGREYEQANQVKAGVTHLVQLRWQPDFSLLPTMYIVLSETRRLNVETVIDIEERNITWELLCREVIGQEVEA